MTITKSDAVKRQVISSLLDLEVSSSDDEESIAAGFPFNVPDELTVEEAKDLDRIIARGVPDREWVEAVRNHLRA